MVTDCKIFLDFQLSKIGLDSNLSLSPQDINAIKYIKHRTETLKHA